MTFKREMASSRDDPVRDAGPCSAVDIVHSWSFFSLFLNFY